MRTQKAEKITNVTVENSEILKNNPNDEEKLAALETDILYLVERVRTMVVRMT